MAQGAKNEGVTGQGLAKGKPSLIDVVRIKIRAKRYSLRTEQAYTGWIRRFISCNGWRHPREMGGVEVEAFLSGLSVEGAVAVTAADRVGGTSWAGSRAVTGDSSLPDACRAGGRE